MNGAIAGGPGYDQIEITAPDGSKSLHVVPSEEFIIGRGPDCGIQIKDTKVSTRHAQIRFVKGIYEVNDLDSRNGTFWNEQRLRPGVREPWRPERTLRVSRYSLRLLLNPKEAPSKEQRSVTVGVPPTLNPTRPENVAAPRNNELHVALKESQLEATPGQPALLTVMVTNLSDRTAHYEVSVRNLPSEWVTIQPKKLELMPPLPGRDPAHPVEPQLVYITITPPGTAKTRAGRFSLEVCVAKVGEPDERVVAPARLSIKPFGAIEAELRQTRTQVGEPLRVSIRNLSNATQQVSLRCWDEASELHFDVKDKSIKVAAGDSAAFEFRARLRKRRWIGGNRVHRFKAKVAGVTTGGEFSGEYISHGLIPKWLPPLLALAIVAAVGIVWNNHEQQLRAEATMTANAVTATQVAIATMTANAIAGAATAAAQQTLMAATQSAIKAATATAIAAATTTEVWLAADSDRDGLVNRREVELGLLPDLADTDSDGLRDGPEVDQYGTDPLRDDSDGDGLKDGVEVERNTNPLVRDTDGDGIIDSEDMAPNATSTPTPDAPATQRAIAEATATRKVEVVQTESAIIARTATAEFIATATQSAANQIATATQSAIEQQREQQRQSEAAQATAAAAAILTQTAADGRATAAAAEQRRMADQATQAAVWTAEAISRLPTATATPTLKGLNIRTYCESLGQTPIRVRDEPFGWGCQDVFGQIRMLAISDYVEICLVQAGFGFVPETVNNTAGGWVCKKQ